MQNHDMPEQATRAALAVVTVLSTLPAVRRFHTVIKGGMFLNNGRCGLFQKRRERVVEFEKRTMSDLPELQGQTRIACRWTSVGYAESADNPGSKNCRSTS